MCYHQMAFESLIAIALIIQAVIFTIFVGRVGVWKSLVSLLILCPIPYTVVPFLSLIPRPDLSVRIYAVLVLQNFFMIKLTCQKLKTIAGSICWRRW